MKLSVEKQLNDLRNELRLVPSGYAVCKTNSDRQKLLVSITQEVCLMFDMCFLCVYYWL
jgi:hypothetical protein